MTDAKKESILGRIRALQAKTTDRGCTEAEAQAAAEAVDRLLAQYELTLDEVTIKTQSEVELIQIEGVGRHAVRFAAVGIAQFTDSKAWLDNHDRDIVFLGLEVDVQIAEYLALLFWRSIDRESGGYVLLNPEFALAPRYQQSDMKWSFEVGMAGRLAERLKLLKSKRDFVQRQTGTSLVLAKQPLIDAAFASLGLSLGKSSAAQVAHHGAYLAGRNAADAVSISQGVAARANGSAGHIR